MGSQAALSQSGEFLELVKSIGECRSKAEEDRIVLREIEALKSRLGSPNTPKFKFKEYLIRLIYVEMLGHDASFGYIHAVKMTHDENLPIKRTGYLAVTLFLNEDHDLIILIVNTIQKDLKSDNYLVVCAALNAVCRLINEETIPAVLNQVVELLGHPKEAVRKKAVMALHRFYRKAPGVVSHLLSNFRKGLVDNDPGVMGAALCPLFDLVKADVDSYKDLVVGLVNILKQVAERRLPKIYDYHQMSAPFIQIKLLKLLALLGGGNKKASEQMYTIVGGILRKCDSTTNIGNAILYECICCVASLHPNPKLLEAAADAVSKFLRSDSHNLKYLGIDTLSRLMKISPEMAEQHQLAVIDCLEDPDDTLKRKTFELLYKMTKSSNVEVIVDRMIEYMMSISDSHYKTEIASRCVELAEQFAPSNQWFILTMNRVFEHAGDLIDAKVGHNLMRLIAEGFGEDDDSADIRSSAVESYLGIMGEPKLPSAFLQVICWVLGEYGTAGGKYSASYISGKLCDVAEAHSTDNTVKGYAVTALVKLYSFEKADGRDIDILPECQSLIEETLASHSTDLQQRGYELQAMLGLDAHQLEKIIPRDSSSHDVEIDKILPFLDAYVNQSIENGAQPYIPERERLGMPNTVTFNVQEDHEPSLRTLKFEAYELPKSAQASVVTPPQASSSSSSAELVPISNQPYLSDTNRPATSAPASSDVKLRLDGVQRKWGQPTFSAQSPSISNTYAEKIQSQLPQRDEVSGGYSSKSHEVPYEPKKAQVVEISPEKQKLAASLFGGPSKSDRRGPSSSEPRASKAAAVKASLQPPVDLLDLGEIEPSVTSSTAPSVDPFMGLESLDFTPQNVSGLSSGDIYLKLHASSKILKTTRDNALFFFLSPVFVSKSEGAIDDCTTDDYCQKNYAAYCVSPNPQSYCLRGKCQCRKNYQTCDIDQDCVSKIDCGNKPPFCYLKTCFCPKKMY